MKKLLTGILVVALTLGCFGTQYVKAVDNIEVNAGYHIFASNGNKPENGYSFNLTIPTGVDMKSITEINQYKADTTYTLQWLTEASIIYSPYEVNNEITEVESKVASTFIRKTTGFWTMFVDGGLTVLDFSNSIGDNKTLDGYYFGVGAKPYKDLRVKLGASVLPITDEPNLFIFGLIVGYKF